MILLKNYLWSVAGKLVKENGFSFIHVDRKRQQSEEEDPSLHFLKNIKRKYIYIRLVPIDFIWPNHLQQDIDEAIGRAEELKKQTFSSEMFFLNLYLFQSSPPSDIHDVIANGSEEKNQKLKVHVGYINLENQQIGTPDDTFQYIEKEPFTYYLSHETLDNPAEAIAEMQSIEKERKKEMKNIFEYGNPRLTYFFILINTILFLLMEFKGGSANTETLLQFGAKEPFLIAQGEYWRLITPVFLHIGLIHFALNNVALYYLGQLNEKIFGSSRFFIIYLLAGIIGNISSFLFAEQTIGAGASGAIFGLFGALLYFGYVHPNLFFRTMGKDVLTIIGVNIVFGLAVPNIDNYAHIGGLIGGFLVAGVVHLPKQKVKKWGITAISLLLIFMITGSVWWGANIREVKGSNAIVIVGENAIEEGNLTQATKIFEHLVQVEPHEPYYQFQLGNILFQKGELSQAEDYYQNAIEMKPDFPEAYYNIALIYAFRENPEQAKQYLRKSLELSPDFKKAQDLLRDIDEK